MTKTMAVMAVIGLNVFGGMVGGQVRMIPHLTAPGGGFETTVFIDNQSLDQADYVLKPFDETGRPLPDVQGTVESGIILEMTAQELFGSASSASHFLIETPTSEVLVRAAYNLKSGKSSPAHVRESVEQKDTWRVYPGDWSLVFDGIAVVNVGGKSTEVAVVQIDASGIEIQSEIIAQNLVPMAKTLFVLGGPGGSPFTARPDTHFEVRASEPLGITALRGTAPGSVVGYLWENAVDVSPAASTTRLVTHVTRLDGGFTSRIIVENTINSSRDFILQPFEESGMLLTPVSGNVGGYGTRTYTLPELFGTEADRVSHFEVVDTPESIQFSVSYRAASGPGSEAIVRESSSQSTSWDFMLGNWYEVFDGFAAVNLGPMPTDVLVEQLDYEGNQMTCDLALVGLQPNAKGLYVLGGPNGSLFEGPEGTRVRVTASQPIALAALRGTIPGAPASYLWHNSANETPIPDDSPIPVWPTCVPTVGGAAEGYVYRTGGEISIAQPENAPVGSSPVNGATIQVVDPFLRAAGRQDYVVSSTQSDADGYFYVQGLQTGLLEIQVLPDGSDSDTAATLMVTSYPHSLIQLGASLPVDRESAVSSVLAQAFPEALIAATMQPLEAGAFVMGKGTTPYDGQTSFHIEQPAWFFFINEIPDALYDHDVTYALVDAQSGAMTVLTGFSSPPLVNYGPLWSSDTDCFYFDVDWEGVDPSNQEWPSEFSADPTPEIVQAPQVEKTIDKKWAQSLGQLLSSEGSPQDIFAIVLNGAEKLFSLKNALSMHSFLVKNGVPRNQIAYIRTTAGAYNGKSRGCYATPFHRINRTIKRRLKEGRKPTFILYCTAHHQKEDGEYVQRVILDFQGGRSLFMNPGSFRLHRSHACKVRAFVEVCSGYDIIYGMAARLDELEDAERPGYALFSASESGEPAYAIPAYFPSDYGSLFTLELLKHLGISGNDITGVITEDGTLIEGLQSVRFALRSVHPQLRYSENTPNRCIHETSLLSTPENPPQGWHTPRCAFATCTMPLGSFDIQNVSQGEVQVTIGYTPDVIGPNTATLLPGEVLPLDYGLDCSMAEPPDTPFDFIIDISASSPSGQTESVTLPGISVPGPDANLADILDLVCQGFDSSPYGDGLPYSVVWPGLGLSTVNSVGRLGVPICMFEYCQVGSFSWPASNLSCEIPPPPGPDGFFILDRVFKAEKAEDYVTAYMVTRAPIPIDGSEWHLQLGFVFDADGIEGNNYQPHPNYPYDFFQNTDRWYSAEYAPGSGWTLEVSSARGGRIVPVSSDARVIFKENAVMLMVPQHEFEVPNPGYRCSIYAHKGDWGLNPPYEWTGDVHPPVDEPLAETFECCP